MTSENSFGILTNRFEVFRSPIRHTPDKAVVITFAALTINNWLIKLKENNDSENCNKIIGNGMVPLVNQDDSEELEAIEMREKIKLFMNNEGSRSWQLDKI